jgi:cell division protein FtsQ
VGRTPSGRTGWERTDADRVRAARAVRSSLPRHFRRRRRIAAVALAAVFLAVGGGLGGRALLHDAGLADVEGLVVTGLRTVPETAVREAAAVTIGVPLAGVDLRAVERRVARIPAVAEVAADRDWPHTVALHITERVPVAIVDTPRGPHLIDTTGVAYLPVPDSVALPKLVVGPVEPSAAPTPGVRAGLDVLAALPVPLRAEVTAVEVGPGPATTVVLRLTEGREVRWGTPDRALEKAAVLVALLTQRGGVYDVASPELPTVRR